MTTVKIPITNQKLKAANKEFEKKRKSKAIKKEVEESLGGKAVGSASAYTIATKNAVAEFIYENLNEFKEAFRELDPKEKCEVYLKATAFVIPKMSSNEINATVENTDANKELKELTENFGSKAI